MRRLCPQCQGIFEAQFLCPNCGVQLLDAKAGAGAAAINADDKAAPPIGMATRFAAGWLLAQGLYFGCRELGTAFWLVRDEPDGWTSASGILVSRGLMASAAVVGGLIAGAGNARGLAAGAAMGLFHAVALLGVELASGRSSDNIALYVFGGVTLTILGALGGRIGRLMFPPLSDIYDPTPVRKADATPVKKTPPPPAPRIAWFRIIGGAALSIGCTVWAGRIRDWIIGTSSGTFTVESRLQSHFIAWVIAALAVMIGGIFAGASTRAGIKHGFLVGLIACVAIFLIHAQVLKEGLPAERFFASVIDLPEEGGEAAPRVALFLLSNALLLAVAGGLVGSMLFPRLGAGASRLDRGAI